MLRIRIRDWVPFWPLDPGSGMGESQHPDPGSGMNNLVGVKILKFFNEDPGSGMETVRIRDGKSRIRDKNPGSATLVVGNLYISLPCTDHTVHNKIITPVHLITLLMLFFLSPCPRLSKRGVTWRETWGVGPNAPSSPMQSSGKSRPCEHKQHLNLIKPQLRSRKCHIAVIIMFEQKHHVCEHSRFS